ncbi:hypothetical protein ACFLZZ_00585 [Nanoarchaeota archaeon]
MADSSKVYKQLGYLKEDLKSVLITNLGKEFDQPIKLKINGEAEITRRYRKNELAVKLSTDIYVDRTWSDSSYVIKKKKPFSDRNVYLNRRIGLALYEIFNEEFERIKNHLHTAELVPESRRKIPLFLKPMAINSDELKRNNLSLTKFSGRIPLDEALEELREEENCTAEHLLPSLDQYALLFDRVPLLLEPIMKRKEKNYPVLSEIKRLEHKINANGEYISDYTKGFSKLVDLGLSYVDKTMREDLKGNLNFLVNVTLASDLETLIQADAYPWHNNNLHLFDNGNICYGSRGLTLGALFGHPDVYLKMENPKNEIETLINRNYASRSRAISLQFHTPKSNIDFQLLTKSFYVGAVCANANLLTEYELKGEDPGNIMTAIESQLKTLGEDYGLAPAKEMAEILSKLYIKGNLLKMPKKNWYEILKENLGL